MGAIPFSDRCLGIMIDLSLSSRTNKTCLRHMWCTARPGASRGKALSGRPQILQRLDKKNNGKWKGPLVLHSRSLPEDRRVQRLTCSHATQKANLPHLVSWWCLLVRLHAFTGWIGRLDNRSGSTRNSSSVDSLSSSLFFWDVLSLFEGLAGPCLVCSASAGVPAPMGG